MALPRSFQVRSLVCALVLGAGGCATVPEQSPEQVVKVRAQARWDALVKGDIETAYGYLGPGSRAVNSLEAYKASIRKGFWTGAQVESAKCEGDTCEVSAQIEYQYRGTRIKTPLAETWIRQQGNWWYVLK
jgi:uncharacterized protein YchJ